MPPSADELFRGFCDAFAGEGLHLVRAVDPAVCARDGTVALTALLPGAAGALIVADGGGAFFKRARSLDAARRGARDPLDCYTTAVVPRVVDEVLARFWPDPGPASSLRPRVAIRYPFDGAHPLLPMQRLGVAAGLPEAGPLGIQIHSTFGPWWAYRALVVLTVPLPIAPSLSSLCAGCSAPCVAACRDDAVTSAGFAVDRCARHRLADAACESTCDARVACVVAPAARYESSQLAFHMGASLATIRAFYRSPVGR